MYQIFPLDIPKIESCMKNMLFIQIKVLDQNYTKNLITKILIRKITLADFPEAKVFLPYKISYDQDISQILHMTS